MVEKSSSIAIPFISYSEQDGFKISSEATEFLGGIKEKIGVISVCGKYRTGKSYLMNKLFLETLNKEDKVRE